MLFRDALLKAGIPVTGSLRVLGSRDPTSPGLARAPWKEIAAVPSPTVGELVREMMKPSQNLYAQLLWLTVGVESGSGVQKGLAGVPLETTEEAGARALDGVLSAAGIASTEVRLEEGSGLSRKNLITPQATVRLLNYMARHRYADAWKASLPVGGVDGTLRQRFTQPGLKGNVRAKTGSLRNVAALSGYLTNSVGEPLAFSIIANNAVPVGGGPSAREQTDALVEQLARSAVREE
jgi:D-alanyl-D-alanine carboxypeptidase/D-alanyl-D-alanine-endopeptidase (penicillin-binding protein 4)